MTLRVRLDSDAPPSDVYVPRSALNVVAGRVVGLQGPRVAVGVSLSRPATPGADGSFTQPGVDLGQTTSFYGAYQTLALAERILGRPLDWGVAGVMRVRVRDSVGASTGGVNAQYWPSDKDIRTYALGRMEGDALLPATVNGRTTRIDPSEDRESIAHEAAHAILHTIKPNLADTRAANALGEAYGDLMAMFTGCDDAATIERTLQQTTGDFRQSNGLSRIAEHLASEIMRVNGRAPMRAVRDATAVTAFPTVREGDAHYSSQVISETVYAVFAERANAAVADARRNGQPIVPAVQAVRDDVARYLHAVIDNLPDDGGTFEQMFATMRTTAATLGPGWANAVNSALVRRGA